MSITITQQPQSIVLSGNQAVLKVVTDNHLEQGKFHIVDWTVPDTGRSVSANFRIQNVRYGIDVWVRMNWPSDHDIVIQLRDNFASFAEYLTHIAAQMTASPLMGFFFESTVESGKVRLTSRIMRSYVVSIYMGAYVGTQTVIQSGTDPIIKEGFRIGARVLDSSYMLMKYDPELREPDLDGNVTYDLADYFSAVQEIAKPLDTEKIKQISGGTNFFRVEVFEWQDNDILDTPTILSFVSVAGKSSFMQEALWNEEGNSFYNFVTNSLIFLSTQPRLKYIAPNAYELLYLFNTSARTLTLKTKVYFSDSNTATIISDSTACDANKMVELDVSPAKLDVFQYEIGDITVLGYDVWIEAVGISSHEVRQYRFDRNKYDQSRTYLVRNDFGRVWETIRATGEAVIVSKFERNSIERTLPLNYTTSDSNVEDIENKVVYEFQLDWGFLSRLGDARAWKHYIMAAELSRKVFELIAGYMIPCKFTTTEADFDADNRSYYTHVSKYRRAYFDTAYSPDDVPVVGDYNDDYNDDYYN